MKVDAVKNLKYNTTNFEINTGNKYRQKIDQNVSNTIQLPNYESVSSKFPLKISFGGNFPNMSSKEANDSYIKQIEEAKAQINVLLQAEDSDAVKTAIEENEFYDDFYANNNTYYYQAKEMADAAEDAWRSNHGWLYRVCNQGELSSLRNRKMEFYWDKHEKANRISSRYETNKALIKSENENAAARATRINELKAHIESLKKLIDYVTLSRTIDEALIGHGGLNDRIAGYSSVKNKIRKFIESISASKNNEDAYVSPCVILYGDTGTGKTTFLRAIEHMASDDVSIIRFSNDDKEPFMRRFQKACKESQKRYLETGKRTILLMDDAEKYFCMPTAEAKSFYMKELDASDLEKLETINNSGTNSAVKDFKAVLDVLSQVPDEEAEGDSYKSAMSIFITTNHPNLIDRQLIKRPEKMDAYHVGPAEKEDLNAVVEFYFKDKERILNELKLFKDRQDMEAAIDSLSNIDIDAKNSIKRNFSQQKADLYEINPSIVDYNTLTEDIQPSLEEGAYSNVMIKRISFNAFEKYLQNPEDPYQVYFYDELENSARDIEPQRYKRYIETAKQVNLYKESQRIINIEDQLEYIKLLNKRNSKLISKADAASLEGFLKDMQIRLQALEEKMTAGTISENECAELEQLRNQEMYNQNPQKVKEYLKQHKEQKAKGE